MKKIQVAFFPKNKISKNEKFQNLKLLSKNFWIKKIQKQKFS